MVERGTGRALAFPVPNRTRKTLGTGLVQKFVEPGTTIISDTGGLPFALNTKNFNLNSVGYIHLMVNHSEKFVDPNTGTLKHNRRCMESNQEKAEGDERDSEEQTLTSTTGGNATLVIRLTTCLKPSQSSAQQTKFT